MLLITSRSTIIKARVQTILTDASQVKFKASDFHLGDVDSGPEQLQVLPHLLWLELGVENC